MQGRACVRQLPGVLCDGDPVRLQPQTDMAARCKVPRVRGQAIADIDHGAGPVPQKNALVDARFKLEMLLECAPAKLTGHIESVAGVCAFSHDRRTGRAATYSKHVQVQDLLR